MLYDKLGSVKFMVQHCSNFAPYWWDFLTLKITIKINVFSVSSASLYAHGTCLIIIIVHLMQQVCMYVYVRVYVCRKRTRVSYDKGTYPTLTLSALLGHTSRNTFSMKGCLEREKTKDRVITWLCEIFESTCQFWYIYSRIYVEKSSINRSAGLLRQESNYILESSQIDGRLLTRLYLVVVTLTLYSDLITEIATSLSVLSDRNARLALSLSLCSNVL